MSTPEYNTTTCAHCGQDYRDRDMLPLPNGGELCGDCNEALRDAAPDLLAALERIERMLPQNGWNMREVAREALAGSTTSCGFCSDATGKPSFRKTCPIHGEAK